MGVKTESRNADISKSLDTIYQCMLTQYIDLCQSEGQYSIALQELERLGKRHYFTPEVKPIVKDVQIEQQDEAMVRLLRKAKRVGISDVIIYS